MKVKELNSIIDNIITEEARKAIIKEMGESKKQVFHIKCDGQPVATFDSEQQANEELPKYKNEHPDKELIIEPAIYESHGDMIDKLDEMGEELDETEDQNMENQEPTEGKSFTKKLMSMTVNEYGEGETDYLDSNLSEKKEPCTECGHEMEENKESKVCSECGKPLNEEGMCNECGVTMKESKKRTLRLTQTELVNLVGKMVSEAQIEGEKPPSGIPGVIMTKKAQAGSKKENEDNMKNVEKKMKKYLSFPGNDNPEFPHQIGGDKAVVVNTPEQEAEIAKNVPGPQNLDYDLEPTEEFKKRLKMSIDGDSKMGNALGTEKPSIKPSNGAPMGKEATNVNGNKIPSNTAKKMHVQIKGRAEDKKNRVLYPKESVPVSETKLTLSNIVEMDIEKMKNLTNYNKKTQ